MLDFNSNLMNDTPFFFWMLNRHGVWLWTTGNKYACEAYDKVNRRSLQLSETRDKHVRIENRIIWNDKHFPGHLSVTLDHVVSG